MPRKLWFINLLASDATWTSASKSYRWTGLIVPNFVCAGARHTIILRSYQATFTPSATAGEIGTSAQTNTFLSAYLPFLSNGIVSTMSTSLKTIGIGHNLHMPVAPRSIETVVTECRYFFDVNTIAEIQEIIITKDGSTDDLRTVSLVFEVDIA